jgi:hypothetical protein
MRPRPPFAQCALPSAPAAPRLHVRRRGDQRCHVALSPRCFPHLLHARSCPGARFVVRRPVQSDGGLTRVHPCQGWSGLVNPNTMRLFVLVWLCLRPVRRNPGLYLRTIWKAGSFASIRYQTTSPIHSPLSLPMLMCSKSRSLGNDWAAVGLSDSKSVLLARVSLRLPMMR